MQCFVLGGGGGGFVTWTAEHDNLGLEGGAHGAGLRGAFVRMAWRMHEGLYEARECVEGGLKRRHEAKYWRNETKHKVSRTLGDQAGSADRLITPLARSDSTQQGIPYKGGASRPQGLEALMF